MNEEQKQETAMLYQKMIEEAISSDAQLIVLDEVVHAVNFGLITKDEIERLFKKDTEIVLTGRDAPKWLNDLSDYISDINKVKHPYDQGIQARVGIEF